MLTIRELSQKTKVSPYTLRYYEREGLVPGVLRQANGHRSYDPQHIFWVAFLRRLRATGMTIGEMKEYAELVRRGEGTLEERQKLLGRHRKRLKRRIQEFKDSLRLLDLKLDFYRDCQEGRWREGIAAYLAKQGRDIDGRPLKPMGE